MQMAVKIRVHELAAELGIENKEIVNYLTGKGITGKTAVSLVPEAEIVRLRELYSKTEQKEEPSAPSAGTPSSDAPKKKKIVRVVRKQNAEGQLLPAKENQDAPRPVVKKVIRKRIVKVREAAKTPEDAAAAAPAPAPAVTPEPAIPAAPEVPETPAAPAPEVVRPDISQPAEPVKASAETAAAPVSSEPAEKAAAEPVRPAPKKPAPDMQPKAPATSAPAKTPERKQGVKILRTAKEREESMARKAAEAAARKKPAPSSRPSGKNNDNPQGSGERRRGPAQNRGGNQQDRQKTVYTVRHDVPAASAPAKGGRDARGKDRDRMRGERRGFEDGNSRSKFNRVPKALQGPKPTREPEKKIETVTEIVIPERITIRDLAEKMHVQASAIIKNLFMKGEIVTVNHEVPFEKAEEIAMEFDIIAELEEKEDVIGELLKEEDENEKDLTPRPPVVCVMGHVDHGKTSLLDAIRDTHVTDRESGGITQHIGAYTVSIDGRKITFLDTPGHEAFTAMRMRGANSTDIAVLVVAADDGVMPQTVEAINHAKAAGVEIIVAINKIDKPAANIDRVKQELSDYQLIPEDWGGSTVFCPVSAKTHEGIDTLLEMILLTADVMELKANPNRNARGLVLEAKLDRGRGPVATILVQKGTLRQGDFIACGACSGKVRAMTDDKGRMVRKATPSMPVEIIGLNAVPNAGEVLVALDSDKEAKTFAATFVTENKKSLLEGTQTQMSLNDLFSRIKEGNLKELPIVVKADVQGSVEAVSQSLVKLSNDEIVVKVIHGAVGAISESDVSLAAASNAIIIGFNVKPDALARGLAETSGVDMHTYSVIYQVIDDVERAIKGMRAAVFEEKILGHATIRQIFKASNVGNIAGSYVTDGTFERDCRIRISRGGKVIYNGDLQSLKRFKDDVREVREGFECGLVFEGFNDFEVDDVVEAFKMVEVERE